MSAATPPSPLQQAISFYSHLQVSYLQDGAVAPPGDYEALAEVARERGYEVTADAMKTAFRILMTARIVRNMQNAEAGANA